MTSHICKYAVMLEDPADIRFHLEKAWHLMNTGRPGPVWIDVPVNYQAAEINPEELRGYDPSEENGQKRSSEAKLDEQIDKALEMLKEAKRPVIYAGGGIRISGGYDAFRKVVDKLGIPVCTYWNSIDVIESDNPLYCGRGGNMGDRPGNFAIQNSDLVLVLGSRLSIRQVGYTWDTWARAAKVIMVDIDPSEMDKHTLHVDLKIHADVKEFLEKLSDKLNSFGNSGYLFTDDAWRAQCIKWKEKYPVVSDEQLHTGDKLVNVYGFIKALSDKLPKGSLTAVSTERVALPDIRAGR